MQFYYALSLIATVAMADQADVGKLVADNCKYFGKCKNYPNKGLLVATSDMDTKAHYIRGMERVCLALGGNVFMSMKDKYGDVVEMPAFNQASIDALTEEEKRSYIEFKPDSTFYKIPIEKVESLYAEGRIVGRFIKSDIWWTMSGYNTTCRSATLGTIYTTDSTKSQGAFDVMYRSINTQKAPASPAQPLEDYFKEFIVDSKKDKILLDWRDHYKYPALVQKYCDEAGGSVMVEGGEYLSPLPLGDERFVSCAGVTEPFTYEYKGGRTVITKNTFPEVTPQQAFVGTIGEDRNDPFIKSAIMASSLPIGANSENNQGNLKTVATVYADFGSYKLVNVQEVGGKQFKNFRVVNGRADDITARGYSFSTMTIPSTVTSAKTKMAQQCVAYGAANASIEGYGIMCTRQSFGSGCTANFIYTKGDQYIGKEAVPCK